MDWWVRAPGSLYRPGWCPLHTYGVEYSHSHLSRRVSLTRVFSFGNGWRSRERQRLLAFFTCLVVVGAGSWHGVAWIGNRHGAAALGSGLGVGTWDGSGTDGRAHSRARGGPWRAPPTAAAACCPCCARRRTHVRCRGRKSFLLPPLRRTGRAALSCCHLRGPVRMRSLVGRLDRPCARGASRSPRHDSQRRPPARVLRVLAVRRGRGSSCFRPVPYSLRGTRLRSGTPRAVPRLAARPLVTVTPTAAPPAGEIPPGLTGGSGNRGRLAMPRAYSPHQHVPHRHGMSCHGWQSTERSAPDVFFLLSIVPISTRMTPCRGSFACVAAM